MSSVWSIFCQNKGLGQAQGKDVPGLPQWKEAVLILYKQLFGKFLAMLV